MKLSEGHRKDIQWIVGLLALALCTVTVGLFAAVYITSRSVAVEAAATGIAAMFSSRGLDDESEIAVVKARLQAGQVIQPIPGLPVRLNAGDIQDKSPREIRLMITRQIAEPIYDGEEAIEQFTGRQFTREQLMQQYGIILFLSHDSHLFLRKVFLIALIPTLLALTALVLLSRRWGRLVSVALVVGAASLPWAVVVGFVGVVASQATSTDEGPIPGLSTRLAELLRNAIPPVAGGLARVYISLLLASILLLITALVGKIVSRTMKKRYGKGHSPA